MNQGILTKKILTISSNFFLFFGTMETENGGVYMEQYFIYDEHLGIEVPELQEEWEDIPENMQHAILLKWEQIRGKIPDRIKELEYHINQKQQRLNNEENFEISCKLNSEIADLASIINDLWLWYRLTQHVSEGKAHQ